MTEIRLRCSHSGGYRSNMVSVLIRRGKTPCEHRGRDWSPAAPSHEMPRTDSYAQKLGRDREGFDLDSWTEDQGAVGTLTLDV